ncbi:MAG TPA: hypothetical protein VHE32_10265 [Rhodanobacteraceae bacterium]|nr:hypothetical protein [Rhodanobacteraceae bacterium]
MRYISGVVIEDRSAEPEPATLRLCAMATFRDGEASRRQIGTQLDPAEADFARCLAMSGWAVAKPLRLLVFGLPMHATLDECLVARLRDAGRAVAALDDDALRPCLDARWEFVRGNEVRPARYRPAPSYRERLRVALLADAWERIARQSGAIDRLDTIACELAAATGALAAHLALPIALLRRAAAEFRFDADAEERLARQLRRELLDLREHDIGHLAITAALDGAGDLADAVQRHGTPPMQILLRAHVERAMATSARATLKPRLARVRRALWAPLAGD